MESSLESGVVLGGHGVISGVRGVLGGPGVISGVRGGVRRSWSHLWSPGWC